MIAYTKLFPFPAAFGLAKSEAEYDAEMIRLDVDNPSPFLLNGQALASIHTFDDNGLLAILCIGKQKGRSKACIAALVAHEATHLCQRIREYVGETAFGRETEAYLIQGITQHALNQLWGEG